MKNIFKIFRMDLKHVVKNAVAMVVIIGICILPALYSWFNVAANWDPYGNTKDIAVAVYNNDKGYKNDLLSVNAGDQIISALKENKDIGWEFVDSKKEALDMAECGDAYAAIIIPKNFSTEMTSVLDGELKIPAFDYYVNEKKNAIAPKITDKGASAIQQQVNTTFISVVVETIANFVQDSNTVLNSNEGGPLDGFIATLNNVNGDLDTLKNAVDSFAKMSESVESLVSATKNTLPNLSAILNEGKGTVSDVTTLMNSTKTYSLQVNKTLDEIIGAIDPILSTMDSQLDTAVKNLDTTSDNAVDDLKNINANAKQINDINDGLITALQDIESLPTLTETQKSQIETLITKLTNVNKFNNDLMDKNNLAIESVNTGKQVNDDVIAKVRSDITKAQTSINSAKTYYLTTLKPALDTTLNNMYNTLSGVSSMLTTASNGITTLDTILDGSVKSINSASSALQSTSKVIDSTKEKITHIITELNSVNSNEQVSKLMELIKNDPTILGDYVSSPVKITTHKLYDIKNYGSAMAPFYSILAIWVGGIVMVAILKVKVNDEDLQELDKPKAHQLYFGRLLTFLFFGIIQAVIITLGCLLYLQIQCIEPVFFVLSGVISSMVFVTIIYTLTISFGDIGKALCVVLLVIQIGGSGGTFPIQLTPDFFQAIYPWMPFTYGIDAMRECVAGFYQYAYLHNLFTLLLYVPFALLLGLVLRKPLIKVNTFIEKRLEDTGFM